MTRADTLTPGTRFTKRYQVLSLMGEGAFGRVYRAKDRKLKREVALKVLRMDLDIPNLEERFNREVSLARRIEHGNVVRLYDYGKHRDLLFMALELVDGIELQQVITEQGPFTLDRATQIALQVLDALAEAHSLGVIHRDLKPENILLTKEGLRQDVVKLLDFGIAKAMNTSASAVKITRDDSVCGTPLYMSPEQFRSENIGPHSDLYATGLVFLEMLLGRPVIEATNLYEIVAIHVEKGIQIPAPFSRHQITPLLKKSLARDWRARYSSAAEMWADLKAVSQVRGSSPPPVSLDETLISNELNVTEELDAFLDAPPSSTEGGVSADTPEELESVDDFFDAPPPREREEKPSLSGAQAAEQEEWWQNAVSSALSKPVTIPKLPPATQKASSPSLPSTPTATEAPEAAQSLQEAPEVKEAPPPSTTTPPSAQRKEKVQLLPQGPKPIQRNTTTWLLLVLLVLFSGLAATWALKPELIQIPGLHQEEPRREEVKQPGPPPSYPGLSKPASSAALAWLPYAPLSVQVEVVTKPQSAKVLLDGRTVCEVTPCGFTYLLDQPGQVLVKRRRYKTQRLELPNLLPLNEPIEVELQLKK